MGTLTAVGEYTIVKKQVECYQFRHKSGMYWADIMVDCGAKGGRITITSDFGKWWNWWGVPGLEFKTFLLDMDIYYAAEKFGADKEFDQVATIAAYTRDAQRYKDNSNFYSELNQQIDSLRDIIHRDEFLLTLNDCRLIKVMYDGCPEMQVCISNGFKRFWNEVWPLFVQTISNEV